MKISSESIAVAAKVVSTCAANLFKIHGYFRGTTAQRWLQVFDGKVLPGNGATPRRTWPLYTDAPFGEGFLPDPVAFSTGMVFAVSTTQSTLTASVDTMDLFILGDQVFDSAGLSTAGDYTTADEVLAVWADASGPRKLYRLEVSDEGVGSGGVFVQIHAGDTPATDKIVASFPLPDNQAIDLFFGGGISPSRNVGGVEFNGCTIAISSTQNTYTALGSNVAWIKASYR